MSKVTKEASPLVLLDGDNAFYACAWANQNLTNAKGDPTGATYGFLRALVMRAQMHGGLQDVIVCWGGRRSALARRQIYAAYKANRDDMEVPTAFKQARCQLDPLKKLLTACGVKQAWAEGYEADDVLAVLARNADRPTIIYTNDHDMRQLVSDNVSVHSLMTEAIWTPEKVREEYGVRPEYLKYVYALCGDKGDNVPGVPKIGLKTACKVVMHNGEGPQWRFPLQGVSRKVSDAIEEAIQQVKLNSRLVSLGGCEAYIEEPNADPYYVKAEFDRLEIKSMGNLLEMVQAYE